MAKPRAARVDGESTIVVLADTCPSMRSSVLTFRFRRFPFRLLALAHHDRHDPNALLRSLTYAEDLYPFVFATSLQFVRVP